MQFSFVIPTYNGEKTIKKLVERLEQISKGYSTEIIVIDSSSSDKTPEILDKLKEDFKNLVVYKISKKSFNHGLTRNFGVKKSSGKYISFATQDVFPKNQNTLKYVLEDFRLDRQVVGVFTKDLPYKNTPVIQRLELVCRYAELDRFLGKRKTLVQNLSEPFVKYTKKNKFLWYFFSDTFSFFKKSYLIKHPFPKTSYGEDVLMGKQIIEAGLIKIYDARIAVSHSHFYNLVEYYKRQKVDFSFRTKTLNVPQQNKFTCKLAKILQTDFNPAKKLYYLLELFIYYFAKLIAYFQILILDNSE